jgi:hypothetical protein
VVAVLACAAVLFVLLVVGPYLGWPALLGVAAAVFVRRRDRRRIHRRLVSA